MNRAQLFALAHALGHSDPALWETRGGRFYVTCSCGYQSTTRRTPTDALGAGVHHALKIAKEAARDGVSLPEIVGPSL